MAWLMAADRYVGEHRRVIGLALFGIAVAGTLFVARGVSLKEVLAAFPL